MVMCDAHLEQLREKTKQWIECLDGDDDNSISKQLCRMTWNITAFRVLMEKACDLAPDAKEGGKQLNRLLFGLLQESFSESLLLGLRRLMDPAGLDGPRGVCSLLSLLDDIGRHSHLLIREAIIQLGPPDGMMKDGNHGEMFLHDWAYSKNRLIDELIGVTEGNRSRDDRIPRKLFEAQRNGLTEKFERLENLINKEIAHAATPESREGFVYQGILWGDLYVFHGELCRAAKLLQQIICDGGVHSFLPVALGGQFDFLLRPLVAENDIPKLAQRWAELNAEYESWGNWQPRPAITE